MIWFRNPAVSILLTLLAYAVAVRLHHRWRWLPPIVVTCLPIAALLVLFHEPYAEYNRGGNYLTWLLGPATVALAVPMYRNGKVLRRSLPILAAIVLAGSVVGMVTAGVTAWLLGAPLNVVMSAVPKSVTTPIAIEVCRELNGIPQITIAMVVLAGVLGASFGVPLLRLVGVREDRAIGAAIGTASHGVGTASLMHRSEMQATVSSWAMAAAAVFTSLLAALLKLFLP
jgi:predicted murein hydrolase (TIGR00659 family)